MDEVDRKILVLLQRDGRRSSADLAKEIGLSVSATNERVRKLIDNGTVRSVQAIIDPDSVGFHVTAFIFVDLDYAHSEEEFVTRMQQLSQVQELHHVTGSHSYLLKIREETNTQLNKFMTEEVKTIAGVRATETLIALETRKETLVLPMQEQDTKK